MELLRILGSPRFIPELAATVGRGFLALLIILLAALPLGLGAGRSAKIDAFLTIPVAVVRSTPVISVILLALIWFPSGGVPVFAAVLMGFPLLYENLAAGMRNVDREYLEMVQTFRLGRSARLRNLYLPAVAGYLGSGVRSASGIVWKVVVAAEVLSQPGFGIGSRLYESRIYLETAGVFAWTALLIVISVTVDKLLSLLGAVPVASILGAGPGAVAGAPGPRARGESAGAAEWSAREASSGAPGRSGERGVSPESVAFSGVSKRFEQTNVLERFDLSLPLGRRSVILGPSGCGKTTILRLIAGLEHVDEGALSIRRADAKIAYAFQEPRLLPWLTAEENLLLPREPGRRYRLEIGRILELLGLGSVAGARPAALSGGMRQRLGLARALAVEADLLLLDEPFSAVDVETRRSLRKALKEELLETGQTVIAVTHDIHDAVVLGESLFLFSDRPMTLTERMDLPEGGDATTLSVEVYRRMVQTL